MLLAHEANAALPPGRRVVQDVVDLEPVREHRDQVIELDAEQDIVLVHVGVDECELGGVAGVEERVACDLEHGCNTGTACDHAKLGCQSRLEGELTLGALDTDFVVDLEQGQVARDVSFLVRLLEHFVRE